MDNNINIRGTLHIECECAKCGAIEEVKYHYDCNDWLTGYDIDITLSHQNIADDLVFDLGWGVVNDKFLCSDCVAEMKGDNNE